MMNLIKSIRLAVAVKDYEENMIAMRFDKRENHKNRHLEIDGINECKKESKIIKKGKRKLTERNLPV
jgi:hypothetical protein